MSHKRKVLQGSASNLVRVLLSMLVSLVLPPFLVHHMTKPEYSAWVLILQLSAYIYLLDFGLQTAIGKYVAEYDASGERDASHHLVSTSFTLLALAAAICLPHHRGDCQPRGKCCHHHFSSAAASKRRRFGSGDGRLQFGRIRNSILRLAEVGEGSRRFFLLFVP
jgi:hypothetical protein